MARDRHQRVDLVVGGALAGFGSSTEMTPIRSPFGSRSGTNRASSAVQAFGSSLGRSAARSSRPPSPSRTRRPARSRRRGGRSARRAARHPGLAWRALPDQLLDRLLRADRGRGEHVVERGPVDVHDDGAVAEQLADRAADVLEHLLKIRLVANERGALEHLPEAGDRWECLLGFAVYGGGTPVFVVSARFRIPEAPFLAICTVLSYERCRNQPPPTRSRNTTTLRPSSRTTSK